MTVIIRVRKFISNKLLSRRQMLLDIVHPDVASVSRNQLKTDLAKKFKTDEKNIVVYGLKTQYGGGRSVGFCLVYENHQYLLKYEPKNRLRKLGILPKRTTAIRKSNKELKGKILRTRGKERSKLKVTKKGGPVEFRKQMEEYLKNLKH
jgi:small subunit ribosomal protein S24e